MSIINGGVCPTTSISLKKQAFKSIKCFAKDLRLPLESFVYDENQNTDGFYHFTLTTKNNKEITIEIPNQDSKVFTKGIPFKSSRCYVDGESWLYGFALNIISSKLNDEYDEENE